jgi:hypothetical protein
MRQRTCAVQIVQPPSRDMTYAHPERKQFGSEAGMRIWCERDDLECHTPRMKGASFLDDHPLCPGYTEVVDDEHDTHVCSSPIPSPAPSATSRHNRMAGAAKATAGSRMAHRSTNSTVSDTCTPSAIDHANRARLLRRCIARSAAVTHTAYVLAIWSFSV